MSSHLWSLLHRKATTTTNNNQKGKKKGKKKDGNGLLGEVQSAICAMLLVCETPSFALLVSHVLLCMFMNIFCPSLAIQLWLLLLLSLPVWLDTAPVARFSGLSHMVLYPVLGLQRKNCSEFGKTCESTKCTKSHLPVSQRISCRHVIAWVCIRTMAKWFLYIGNRKISQTYMSQDFAPLAQSFSEKIAAEPLNDQIIEVVFIAFPVFPILST